MDVRDGRGRDLKVEKWSGRVVVPGVNVEESKDWIVGMLLRTKQVGLACHTFCRPVSSWREAFADYGEVSVKL